MFITQDAERKMAGVRAILDTGKPGKEILLLVLRKDNRLQRQSQEQWKELDQHMCS